MAACMRTMAAIFCALVLGWSGTVSAVEKGITVTGVRYFSYSEFTRVVFELEAAAPYVLNRSGDGRTVSFGSYGGPFTITASQLPAVNDSVVKQLEARQDGDRRTIAIVLAPGAGEVKDFVLRGPDRIVIDVLRGTAPASGEGASAPVIVLDPGHGGPQSGLTTGANAEKALTLELAHAVRKLLRAGAARMKVLLTRDADQGISLDERAAVANGGEATLFISLHMAPGADARVFILDPDEGQPVSAGGGPSDFLGFDAVSDQQQTLWGTQQARHARESGKLGRMIARALVGREDAEPDQASLAVLRPVDAPAVLVEIGFGMDRAKVAGALAQGIDRYVHEKR